MSSVQVQKPVYKASIPGKFFVLGEYLALEGGPALVGALEPRFEFQFSSQPLNLNRSTFFHLESPTGLWIKEHASQFEKKFQVRVADPYLEMGNGGFGGSTAQFIAVSSTQRKKSSDSFTKACWETYRALTEVKKGYPPSGLDLVAQLEGGFIQASFSFKKGLEVKDHSKVLSGEHGFHFAVYSASHQESRKLKTHEHLSRIDEALNPKTLSKLDSITHRALDCLTEQQAAAFGRSMVEYAEVLGEVGFETKAAREDRLAFLELPGVLGVKGCGAGLTDALVLLVQDNETLSFVSDCARARDLRCLTQHWVPAQGAQFEGEACV